MKHQTKLAQKQEHVAEQQTQQQAREFASSEELLRFDAAQVSVPPEIAQRLEKSAANIHPPAGRPWWKTLFGG